ncbi:MAG: serine--tRNA ligase, partial [Thermofilum sp.]
MLYLLRNNPQRLIDNMKARFLDTGLVEEAIRLDTEWRAKKKEYDEAKHELN